MIDPGKKLKAITPPPADAPAAFDVADVAAIQGLAAGTADAQQQQRALRWIVEHAAGTYVWPYRKDERETNIALGRMFVGQQIVGLTKVDIGRLRRQENVN